MIGCLTKCIVGIGSKFLITANHSSQCFLSGRFWNAISKQKRVSWTLNIRISNFRSMMRFIHLVVESPMNLIEFKQNIYPPQSALLFTFKIMPYICKKSFQRAIESSKRRVGEQLKQIEWFQTCDRSAVCLLFWKVYSVDASQNGIHTTLLQHRFKFNKKQTSPINANEKKKPKLDHNINGTGSRFSACMLIYQNAIFLLRHAVSSIQATWSCHNDVKEPISTLSWQSFDQLTCK